MKLLRWACHCASILVLFAACAFAQSQQPPGNTRNAASSGNNQSVATPPINVTVTTPQPSPEATRRDEERQERNVTAPEDVRDFTRALSILAFVQAGITFVALLYSIRAANAAKHSAEAANASTKLARDSAAIALAQKRIGDRQLRQMEEQVTIGRRTMIAANRAYISVKKISVVKWGDGVPWHMAKLWDSGDTIKPVGFMVSMVWINEGNTPALDVRGVGCMRKLNSWDSGELVQPEIDQSSTPTTVAPKDTFVIQAGKLTFDEIRDLSLDDLTAFVCGRIEYRTAFEETGTHYSETCTRVQVIANPRSEKNPFRFSKHGEHNRAT